MAQKTTTKQDPTKTVAKTAEVKAPVKAAEPVKKEEAPAAVAAKSVVTGATAKKAEKPAEKKAEKPAAKKAEKPAAKKAAKEVHAPEIYIQFAGTEAVVADITERVKAKYVDEGHRVSSIKTLQIYLKPEENAAYYVINQKTAGKVDLF
jgi:hypothetical protein